MKNLLSERAALQHSVTIYVPTTMGSAKLDDKDALVSEMVDYVAKQLAEQHGGFTVTKGKGGWVNQAGELVHETVYMVRANAEKLSVADTNQAVRIAEYVKQFMLQDLVSLEIDGKLYFI